MSEFVIARYAVTDVTEMARGDDAEWAVTLTRAAPRPGEPAIREPITPWVLYLDTADVSAGDEFALVRVRRGREEAGRIGGPVDEGAGRGTGAPGPVDAGAEQGAGAELAALRARVDRLERQLAVMVTRFSERLNDRGRRLDQVDEPPERRWFDR